MGTPCVIATVSALNLGIDFKSVPSMPPPDSFNRGLHIQPFSLAQ